jgi:branched-chain amino acid transport system ATP-binding protein
MLQTTGLTKQFGGLIAVDDVDFAMADEELCSIIGPNGAGKTTFFNLITGALSPSSGTIEFNSKDLTDATLHETAEAGIHRSYQTTNIFPTRTVLDNVRIALQAHRKLASNFWRNANHFQDVFDESRRLLRKVDLADSADTPADTLSHGAKRQLELALTLAGDPDLVLLDEPTAGVSSENLPMMTDLLTKIVAEYPILLVEHNMDVVMELSDRIVVLDDGQIIADGAPDGIRKDEAVQQAYLGTSEVS